MKKVEYCEKCNCLREYEIKDEKYEIEFENKLVKYDGKKAVCKCCNYEVFNEEVEEYNQKAFEKAYIAQYEIIGLNQIDEILKKYNIAKRPLSLILGFGETTISRYYQGYIPSIKHSIILKKVLNDSDEYYSYLMANKEKLTDIAYKKTKEKVDVLLGLQDENNRIQDNAISNVAKYIINTIEITNLGLQKLLYYIQCIFSCCHNKSLFLSKCSAWAHGPVFGKIYYEYKKYGYEEIESNKNEKIELEEDVKEIVDNVIKYFGCYSAKTLEFFTHNEDPWINATYKEDNVIEKSDMKRFGEKMFRENGISSPNEINKYSEKMHKKYLDHLFG